MLFEGVFEQKRAQHFGFVYVYMYTQLKRLLLFCQKCFSGDLFLKELANMNFVIWIKKFVALFNTQINCGDLKNDSSEVFVLQKLKLFLQFFKT